MGDGGSPEIFDYRLDEDTEVPYLFAHGVRLARVVYEDADIPDSGSPRQHVFFELGDHLGSTSVVLDKATGELVERGTYQPYGAAESDYRPDRWKNFREDYRFTGKEEDVEVGLQYFGFRYLSPYLNRWASADPLAIHGAGADLNAYAYVSGRALVATDPLGLDGGLVNRPGCTGSTGECNLGVKRIDTDVANLIGGIICMASGGCGAANAPGRGPKGTVPKGVPQKSEAAKMLDTAAFVSGGRAVSLLGRAWRTATKALPVGKARFSDVGEARLPNVGTARMPDVERVAPIGGKVNVGGGMETPNASNLNAGVPNTGGPPLSEIPNLVKGRAEQIGELFQSGSAKVITSAKLPYHTVNWEKFAKGAFGVSSQDGKVLMNTWVQGNAAEQAAARTRLTDAFKSAGFSEVSVSGEGAGVIVRAVKAPSKAPPPKAE